MILQLNCSTDDPDEHMFARHKSLSMGNYLQWLASELIVFGHFFKHPVNYITNYYTKYLVDTFTTFSTKSSLSHQNKKLITWKKVVLKKSYSSHSKKLKSIFYSIQYKCTNTFASRCSSISRKDPPIRFFLSRNCTFAFRKWKLGSSTSGCLNVGRSKFWRSSNGSYARQRWSSNALKLVERFEAQSLNFELDKLVSRSSTWRPSVPRFA